jgi:membrane-associated PAP2 superfamily phosphatase
MLMYTFIANRRVVQFMLLYLLSMVLLDAGGGDIWLASKLYALEGYQWSLQHHWLTENVLHTGARRLNYLLCSAVLLLSVYHLTRWQQQPAQARRYLALSLSLLSSFTLVAYLKAVTNIACPWSLTLFGGTEPYIHILQHRPDYLPYSQCFPAGHASVGYAWVALFFFFSGWAMSWRYLVLSLAILAGLTLGLTQQLRGAHFLSHDITSLMLCLLCARLCFMVICHTPPQNRIS